MTAFDASVLFGSLESRVKVAATARRVLEQPTLRITSEACLTEAMYLAGDRLGWQGQARLWATMHLYQIEIVSFELELAERLMRKYKDVPMDFADATLVALCSEDPRVRVATFDRDFLAYRRDDGSAIPLVGDRLLAWD